jgi:transposase
MPNDARVPREKFIAVIMRSKTIAAAARDLGCTEQAVSLRLQRWREQGVTWLPDFSKKKSVDEVQELVTKHRRDK